LRIKLLPISEIGDSNSTDNLSSEVKIVENPAALVRSSQNDDDMPQIPN